MVDNIIGPVVKRNFTVYSNNLYKYINIDIKAQLVQREIIS